jgi:hypothetical protein
MPAEGVVSSDSSLQWPNVRLKSLPIHDIAEQRKVKHQLIISILLVTNSAQIYSVQVNEILPPLLLPLPQTCTENGSVTK